jgi:putative membrane protein
MQALLPTISTGFIVLSAILVAIGWYLIAHNQPKKHKKVMIAAAISALLFFIIYMSRTVFLGNTAFGGPDNLKVFYTIFLIFHITLATVGAVFGIITLILAFKRNIKKHRKIGPVTSIIWFFTASTGVVVYLLLYVFFDGGSTTSMLKAIFGF